MKKGRRYLDIGYSLLAIGCSKNRERELEKKR